MDTNVKGLNPVGPQGKHFKCNFFSWVTLAVYGQMVAPNIWQANDEGLDADGAIALATALQNGVVKGHAHVVAVAVELAVEKTNEPFSFSVENVVRFIAFLRECGGFKIC